MKPITRSVVQPFLQSPTGQAIQITQAIQKPLMGSGARLVGLVVLIASLGVVAGCSTPSASSQVYTYGQAQSEQIVRNGTVTALRPITIQKDRSSGAGMIAGGALGGVAGSGVGGGTGRNLAIVGGAILGALVGEKVEEQMGKSDGLEITVRLDNGETRVIAQAADVPFSVGQRVQVISGAGPVRVAPM